MMLPQERHEREQCFYRPAAARRRGLEKFETPCILRAPLVGAEMPVHTRARVPDIDERFDRVPGFRRCECHHPEHLGEAIGMIVRDPPCFAFALSQLFSGIIVLARHETSMPPAITNLARGAPAHTSVFAPFDLQPTGDRPGQLTVDNDGQSSIKAIVNLDSVLRTIAPPFLASSIAPTIGN